VKLIWAAGLIVAAYLIGFWLYGRYLESPEDPSQVGTEEMVFAQEVVRVLEPS
jgi:hypothetical protein